MVVFALKTHYCCPKSCISVQGEIVLKFLCFPDLLKQNKVYQSLQMKGPGKTEIISKSNIQKIIAELFLELLEVSDQKTV